MKPLAFEIEITEPGKQYSESKRASVKFEGAIDLTVDASVEWLRDYMHAAVNACVDVAADRANAEAGIVLE